MKSVFALALFVGLALGSSSTSPYGWQPQREYSYRYESEIISGIPEIQSQYAGVKMTSEVIVQSFSDFSLRLQFREPRFIVVNEKLQTVEGRPRIPEADKELPESWKSALEKPFVAYLKRGVVESLLVDASEPVAVRNIKKALLTQLQLDLTASRQAEVISNMLVKGQTEQESGRQEGSYFTTQESGISGDCQTDYNINKLPKYQSEELEQQWQEEEKVLERLSIISRSTEKHSQKGRQACEGKQYYEVSKTKNYDNCRNRPLFQSVTGVQLNCDAAKSECKDLLTHMTTSRYILCGSPEDFYIREVSTDDVISTVPIAWNTKEHLTTRARVTLFLTGVKEVGTPLPKPQEPKEVKSLVYEFPEKSYKNPQETGKFAQTQEGNQQQSGEEQQKHEFEPIFPMPDMRSASKWAPRFLSTQELKEKVVTEMKKIVEQMVRKPESCTLKTDLAGYISLIADNLRPLSYDEIKEVQSAVQSALSREGEKEEKFAKDLFEDILAMVGTNPAISMLMSKVEQRELQGMRSQFVMNQAIRNVKTPTQQLLKELIRFFKSQKQQQQQQQQSSFVNSGLLELTNLVYKACMEPTSSTTQFPVRVFGKFCSHESQFVTEDLIPFLEQLIQEQSNGRDTEKMVWITALGRVGHRNILPTLVRVIEGEHSKKPMVRSIAVYALKRLAKREPTLVRPALLAIIENIAENADVRIAAVNILPWTQPTVTELNRLAIRSWFEPSKQVAAFIYSTLKNLQYTEVPELKPVALKVRSMSKLVKPSFYGVQYSHNSHSNSFMEQLRVAASAELSTVMSDRSTLPRRVSSKSAIYGGSWALELASTTIYSQGLDKAVEQVLAYLKVQSKDNVNEEISKINQELNIEPRQQEMPEALLQFRLMGMERQLPIDRAVYEDLIQKVAEQFRQGSDSVTKHINAVHAMQTIGMAIVGPSETGLPFIAKKNAPLVVSLQGEGFVEKNGLFSVSAGAKLIPVVSGKIESYMGVILPFTEQLIGAGVDLSLHSAMATEMKVDVSLSGQVTVTVKSPEKVQQELELIHTIVKPYTSVNTLKHFQPMGNSAGSKKILSNESPKVYERKLGERYGIDSKIYVNADYPILDLTTVLNRFSGQTFSSLLTTGPMPISVRQSEIRFTFNPSTSSTKELKTRFSLVQNQRQEEDQEKQQEQGFFSSGSGSSSSWNGQESSWMQSESLKAEEKEVKQMCREEHQSEFEVERCIQQQKQKVEQRKLTQVSQEAKAICQQEHELRQQEQQQGGKQQSEEQKEQAQRLCHSSVHVCEQAKELCKERRQQQQQQQQEQEVEQQCHEKKTACLARQHVLRKVNKVLSEKLEHGSSATGMKFETGFKSGFGSEQTVEATLVMGQESKYRQQGQKEQNFKSFVIVELKNPNSPVYEIEMKVNTEVKQVQHQWDIRGLVNDDARLLIKSNLRYGSQSGEKKEIEVKVELQKSDDQKRSVQQSPEYKACEQLQQSERRNLAPVCTEVRRQAAALDQIQLKIRLPEEIKRSQPIQWLEAIVEKAVWFNMNYTMSSTAEQREQQQQQDQEESRRVQQSGEYKIDFDISRTGEEAKISISSPVSGKIQRLYNLRVPKALQKIIPFTMHMNVWHRVMELISEKQLPSTCELEGDFISTFDNKTYAYNMNGCMHLLYKDCSQQGDKYADKSAVLGEGEQGQIKRIEAILHQSIVKVNSADFNRGQSVKVNVNGEEMEIQVGKPYYKYGRSQGSSNMKFEILHLELSVDNVLTISNRNIRTAVFYDGQRVQILGAPHVFARTCGLCGDMNGENTADVLSPKTCLLSEPRFNAYTYMMKQRSSQNSQSCRGIPSEDRAQFEREEQRCVQKREIITPLKELTRNFVHQTQPKTLKHVVIKQLNKVCISKRLVRVCKGRQEQQLEGQTGSGLEGKKIDLPFTCMIKNDARVENILKRVEGGEKITEIIISPTHFTTGHYVPISCGDEGRQYHQQLNRPTSIINHRNAPRF